METPNPDSFDPLASASPLIVYIDFKSPYAYLAVEPTCAMAADLGIKIDWRPFTLDIASYLGSARLDAAGKVVDSQRTAGQWTKVKYAYHDVRRYASLRDIIVRGTVKIWDSSLVGLGMLWAKAQGPAILRDYMDIAYERFWKRELDLEDSVAIEGVLHDAGAVVAGFADYAAGAGRAFYDRMQRETFAAGIFGVPTFVIDREILFGREHLPRIRWMLSGRTGTPPDVAYNDPSIKRVRPLETKQRQVTVAIDFKSLLSHLAIAPTCALADDLGVEINWQPLVIAPSPIRTASAGDDDRATRHRRIRADYLDRDAIRYARDRGLAIDRIDHGVDSTPAALGLLWAQRQGPAHARNYVMRVSESYWRDRTNIADARAIGAMLVASGVSASGFETFIAGTGRAELDQVQTRLRERGVFEVPTYLVGDDLFLGRQHLPLVRALLSH